ncbi:MAG: hypothetical protein K0Q79_3027 [Flavipsychrobacter sp.]|nr:hypothetical protein [Flavipsychrobacter sp.]
MPEVSIIQLDETFCQGIINQKRLTYQKLHYSEKYECNYSLNFYGILNSSSNSFAVKKNKLFNIGSLFLTSSLSGINNKHSL